MSNPQWQRVVAIFNAGRACIDCLHHHEFSEWHPYAAGRVREPLRECLLLNQSDGHAPAECPGIEKEPLNGNE